MTVTKPYNNYNIFFILERALLIHSRTPGAAAAENGPTKGVTGYEGIDLPPLPPRYQHLKSSLAQNWYDPGRKKLNKRKHTKSHGVATFKEIAKTVASNWKMVDAVTKEYVNEVALLIKNRHKELAGQVKVLARSNTSTPSYDGTGPSYGALQQPPNDGVKSKTTRETTAVVTKQDLDTSVLEVLGALYGKSSKEQSDIWANTTRFGGKSTVAPQIKQDLVYSAPVTPDAQVSLLDVLQDSMFLCQPIHAMPNLCGVCDEIDISDKDIFSMYHSTE